MIPLSLERIAAIVGGRLCDVPDPGVLMTAPAVVDSREIEPGGLFAALVGERVDGHDYAAQTVEAGAVAVLATHPVGVPAVVVGDVLEALALLARHALAEIAEPVIIGLTGSSGKTSTKDLIAQVLPAVLGSTTATARSLNSEIGLPLTVLRADRATRYLVLEMGARGIGHIKHLTEITPPQVGLVINVGTAHVGEFGGREAIAAAKGELLEALPADGLAVLNADDPLVAAMASRTKARVMTFGLATGADVRALDVALDRVGRPSFALTFDGMSAPVSMTLHGEHHVWNALAAAAVALGLGADIGKVAAALSGAVQVTSGRMQVSDRPDGVRVVNDAFNANPDSMRVGLKALAAMADGRRTVAVLGEMKELGEDAVPGHEGVGRLVAECGIDVLVAVGGYHADVLARSAQQHAPELRVLRAADREAALPLLQEELRPGDVVLVKGSHSVGLERTAALLLEADAAGAPV
ncbi:UDP-N-acetylmuramoyl-tripeptide--D-alanyl-D-alanine ligase [Streptomyces sp. H27-H1]|uniref:UDP-N-acetylmuramoyl-tripeptide--D-alanyl-D- alanine ligase n=1 Tax=Streptomyces sp. H27-H1 TaxID=2996461 RepID=UPI00227125BC|nr:UDP-N-acetylmuramoyl-tripeptide--D-alanyl-D-alanine ligase [Streptomyces sp. H27-H1]MCY0930982.1 UDP-N-acetylmuramoyl-tripeptide--D-alanyl-D-alanine ligase [Streptomyces sp. H27-H1]